MQALAPTQRGGAPQPSSTHYACCPRLCRLFTLHCRAGVYARRGALRQPGRILAGQGTAPLSRLTPTAPLAGEPFRRQFPKASPARGGGCAARHRRRGALPPCATGILQPPAGPCPASVGDDLRAKSRHFVPVALRNAACGRQCSHRPANPAMPQTPGGGRSRSPPGHRLFRPPAIGRTPKL